MEHIESNHQEEDSDYEPNNGNKRDEDYNDASNKFTVSYHLRDDEIEDVELKKEKNGIKGNRRKRRHVYLPILPKRILRT